MRLRRWGHCKRWIISRMQNSLRRGKMAPVNLVSYFRSRSSTKILYLTCQMASLNKSQPRMYNRTWQEMHRIISVLLQVICKHPSIKLGQIWDQLCNQCQMTLTLTLLTSIISKIQISSSHPRTSLFPMMTSNLATTSRSKCYSNRWTCKRPSPTNRHSPKSTSPFPLPSNWSMGTLSRTWQVR